MRWSDLNGNVITVTHRNYKGQIDKVKNKRSVRQITLDAAMVERIPGLHSQFANHEWMFQSEAGTPVNPGNALKRYIQPAAKELGIKLGGFHDLRHALTTNLRRAGVHPKVVSDILGHSKVNLAMDVYDRTDLHEVGKALSSVSQMLSSCCQTSD